ncbi:MAG: molybdopterin-dependent oxidoreductase [Ardenticatenaceae bacterium]|nr:molybdopterin-dependent oxidoreductase [Ardenticatenaceae bacterium]
MHEKRSKQEEVDDMPDDMSYPQLRDSRTPQPLTLNVNGRTHYLTLDPETPLLYVLRHHLGLSGPRYGCGLEQCGACKVLIDGQDTPSCQIPVRQVAGLPIITIEGLGTPDSLHPLQEAFIMEQAIQCGYCASGMIIAAEGLLRRNRYPSDDDIRAALSDNICRCGVYDRVRRAIKLRIGRPEPTAVFEVVAAPPLAAEQPAAVSAPQLPPSLQQTPELDAWIRFNDDQTVTIFSGKVEIGQGIKTAVAQIAAEELDVALERVRVVTADTERAPNEGITAGSMSLQTSGAALRVAAAEARHILLAMAFEELEAHSLASLTVADGLITDLDSGRQITYWQLLGGKKFGRRLTGLVRPKTPDAYRLVGQPAARLDLPAKVTGAACYVHDLVLPGMVHGRVVRPPAYDAQLIGLDDAAVRRMPGVLRVLRDGRFLAVIAEQEEQVVRAAAALRAAAVWQNDTSLPPLAGLYDHLRHAPAQTTPVVAGTAVPGPVPPAAPPPDAAHTLAATYTRPYQMHASLSPSAAVAHLQDDKLTVWSHSQGIPLLQQTIAHVLGLSADRVHLIHVEGSGCYGHNGADDAALDAALLAQALPGRPVSLKWTREDEHTWEPYGPAMLIQSQASLDDSGRIVDWNHDVWSFPHTARPRPGGDESGLLAAWHLARPFAPPQARPVYGYHFGDYRNADPLYDLPQRRIVTHFVPDSPLRTSALRSLGAYANVFAIESFMDELAQAARRDPLDFRLDHLADERARAVLLAAAARAPWEKRTRPAKNGQGQGLALARYKNSQCYTAVIVTVRVDLDTGEIHLQQATLAADAGQIVNPDGLSNQLEGGFFQAASWTLCEAVTFDEQGITSRDWDSYPILRFAGAPRLRTVLLNRPDLPFLGSGEAAQGPTPAAIANALFDATGVRLRDLPLTAGKLRRALADAAAAAE